MIPGRARSGGFSFIEVIVASAVMLLFFSGLIAGVKLMLDLIGESKAATGARSLALSRMEYIRSLDYNAIGTVGGIPQGTIAQSATSTLNGVEYTERVLILYIDRPEDGLEEDDENGVLEDSKRVKVEYSWVAKGETRSLALISDVSPKGMETSSGGGTLVVKVFDAAIAAVESASVRVVNTSVATDTIDITLETNSEGRAIIPGAPPRGGYEITVTKSGYSTDGTYSATAENPNPNPPHVAVASSTISTMTFFIDELSDLTLRSIGEPVTHEFLDEFTDGNLLAGQSGTTASGGDLTLADDGGGGYLGSGEAYSTTTAPAAFTAWQAFDWTATVPADTGMLVRLYADAGGVRTLVPDSALPGNAAGFSTGPIDISSLAPASYPGLSLQVSLSTSDASSTPSLGSWSLTYIESEPPIANMAFGLFGTKTIGTDVLKYDDEITTDAGGSAAAALEWDTYTITMDGAATGYDIKEARGILPYVVTPGVDSTLVFELTAHTARTLHVTVTDSNGNAVVGASVGLSGPGYNETLETSIYGQVFFGDLPQAGDYTLSVTEDGYQDHADTVNISGNVMRRVNLTSL